MDDAIMPLDLYLVINNSNIDNQDREILIKLYQPIVGVAAINLYFTLWSELDQMKIMSEEENHYSLMSKTMSDITDIVSSRKLLEAVGLLKTFVSEEKQKLYVYMLYSPLEVNEFINHPILSVMLYSNIGKKLYNKTIDYFRIPKIDLSKYKDITSSFDDVFEVRPSTNYDIMVNDLKDKHKNNIIVDDALIDFNLILSTVPNININKEMRTLISNLSYIYKIDTDKMIDLIIQSIDERNIIDKIKLRKLCGNYYLLSNNGALPTAIFKERSDNNKVLNKDSSKKSKMIYTFETTHPYDFLASKYQGNPTNRDKKILEYLLVDIGLNPGVVNVLIDFVLRTNNQKLTKVYIDTIAGQWSRLGIKTVEDAMNLATSEHKKKYSRKTNITQKSVPEWFDKNIEKKESTEEELKEMEELLKEYR